MIKFISNDFIFDAIVNGIVFFISFSDSLLLVYRNETDLYMMILYPVRLMNLLISSHRFLVGSLGLSV